MDGLMARRWSGLPEFGRKFAGVGLGLDGVVDGMQLILVVTDGTLLISSVVEVAGKTSLECGGERAEVGDRAPVNLGKNGGAH